MTDLPAVIPPAVILPAAILPAVAAPAVVADHERKMLEALVCPVTQGSLHYDVERSELVSKSAGLAFPIRDGIPIMLVDEARHLD